MTSDKRVDAKKTTVKRRKITDFLKKKTETDVQIETEVVEVKVKEDELKVENNSNENDNDDKNNNEHTFKQKFVKTLTDEQKDLLQLEIDTLEDIWFEKLHKEFTKPYFLQLKRFLKIQWENKIKIFPPKEDIYSWSRLTPLNKVKIIILGQDPYHGDNQAHGLAFSVKSPTKPPPSLKNMYKTLKIDYPEFKIPLDKGDLSLWAQQGVLMLNTVLTVKAHEANSHAKKGWEQFTETVLRVALQDSNTKKVLLLWGSPAQKRYDSLKLKLDKTNLLVLKSVHPSPLSAHRGYFECAHFKKSNDWLIEQDLKPINWQLD